MLMVQAKPLYFSSPTETTDYPPQPVKRTIDVCLSPELMPLYTVSDRTVVVVDILRATSCMTTAMAYGIGSITPFAKAEDCLAMKTQGYYTSGERDGKKDRRFRPGQLAF